MTSSSRAVAVHPPIREWQIRILRLHAASKDKDLSGELVAADLFVDQEGVVLHNRQERVGFHALSYAWGTSNLTDVIYIGHGKILITRGLRHALQALRSANEDRYVWVDTLCINQDDDAEKSAQAQRMFSIYMKADRTMVFLGLAGEPTALAIAHLRGLKDSTDSTCAETIHRTTACAWPKA